MGREAAEKGRGENIAAEAAGSRQGHGEGSGTTRGSIPLLPGFRKVGVGGPATCSRSAVKAMALKS